MSNRKPFNGDSGYVCSRRNTLNRGWVVIYVADEQGLDPAGGKYVAVCQTHHTVCNGTSIQKLRSFLKIPEFCEACMGTPIGIQDGC